MSKKTTSVEWLREQFHKVPQSQFGNLFEHALEMERQQIIDAVNETLDAQIEYYERQDDIISQPAMRGEQYYTETFKTNV